MPRSEHTLIRRIYSGATYFRGNLTMNSGGLCNWSWRLCEQHQNLLLFLTSQKSPINSARPSPPARYSRGGVNSRYTIAGNRRRWPHVRRFRIRHDTLLSLGGSGRLLSPDGSPRDDQAPPLSPSTCIRPLPPSNRHGTEDEYSTLSTDLGGDQNYLECSFSAGDPTDLDSTSR